MRDLVDGEMCITSGKTDTCSWLGSDGRTWDDADAYNSCWGATSSTRKRGNPS